ncbi:MAG: hypothetical protein FIA89_13300 [Geobacter sp.]|nr:hypothetical protein [Geobacter sp.]
MKNMPNNPAGKGVSRRDFMKTMAVLGAVASTPGLLLSCSSSSGTTNNATETKTLYFDHSHLNATNHDFYLIVGAQKILLTETLDTHRLQARATNSFLKMIPDRNMTHHAVDVVLPAGRPQLCMVRYIPKGQPLSSTGWKPAGGFLHTPRASIEKAFKLRKSGKYLSQKGKLYGGNFELATAIDLVAEDVMITPFDNATSIIFNFPDCTSLDADSAAYVQKNLIEQNNQDSAMAIRSQGGAWATCRTLTDASGKPYYQKDGTPVQITQYSDFVQPFLGGDMGTVTALIKDDPLLYANRSKAGPNDTLQGKLSIFQNGVTNTNANTTARKNLAASGVKYTLTDVCTGGGYALDLDSISPDGSNLIAKSTVTNSYLRHLGMFVRYLDSNNKPIPVSSIPASFFSQYSNYFTLSGYDGTYDKFLKVIGTPIVVMGIPAGHTSDDVTIPVPAMASKFQIIGNTLGHGDDQYNSLGVGVTLTAVFDLACPSLFLCMAAGSSFAEFKEREGVAMFLDCLAMFGELLTTIVQAFAYADYKAFADLGVKIGEELLGWAAKSTSLVPALLECLAIGEINDAVPFVGEIMNAIGCMACAAQITTTSAECLNSPWNYVKTVNLAHDITVSISHDPQDPLGFPSTATYYVLTATCQMLDSSGNLIDSSTPIQYRGTMPATTQTAPITVTIPNVPYGGSIALAVGFYSKTNWLAGQATLVDDNTKSAFSMTITENKVPLDSTTFYSHKQKTALNASGQHIWTATTTPPGQLAQCSQSAGQICQILNVTNSNTFASVGYTWQGYGVGGQQYFYGNLSLTQNPEQGAIISSGQSSQFRTTYDLMGDSKSQRNFYVDVSSTNNYIRQIRLDLNGKPTIDGPGSNKAWGKLNFSSDALLLHPNGKIISINRSLSKLEVLTLPQAAVADANASPAAAYSGPGTREGLLNGPLCATVTASGLILILETSNNRVQAFDTGGSPVQAFSVSGGTASMFTLKYSASDYTYLDIAAEYTGFIYLLCSKVVSSATAYYLDIYDPTGAFVSRTSNFSGAKISVSYWRDVFAANLEALRMPNGSLPAFTEPTISQWIPSTP